MLVGLAVDGSAAPPPVLTSDALVRHVTRFNAMEDEHYTNTLSNAQAVAWMQTEIPRFECPDAEVEEMYFYRWWSFRKHLVRTPAGWIITEFLTPVGHADVFNAISCATGFHVAEGRWLRDQSYVDDYLRFWFRGNQGGPQKKLHGFSSWIPAAAYDRCLVTGDNKPAVDLLDDFIAEYHFWERERQATNGLYWQFDVRDGMEESISGSRTNRNLRPTINSYMFANARAIAALALAAKRPEVAADFQRKADTLQQLTQETLWDAQAKFFKVRRPDGVFSTAREAVGFVPWMFGLPSARLDSGAAWAQLLDAEGFAAPFGVTTAERRHPQFRSHGVGTCEWDGAVWPFATCQTLYALGNVLQDYPPVGLSRSDYLDAFLTYVHSQHAGGKPYIGEYLDEVTGDWINGKNNRSRYYNHSTFADLLITGIVGLRPQAADVVEVNPLLPDETWDWFCLDGVKYHGRELTILWDTDGTRYRRGQGLMIFADGKEIARATSLSKLSGKLP